MSRNMYQKADRRSWTIDKLSQAMMAVNYGVSQNQAAKEYGIPKRTLRRYLKKASEESLGSFTTVFTSQQEEQLVAYAIQMGECFYGLSPKEVRSLAFQLAERNNISHPFDQQLKLAGPDWLKSFLRRHPTLSLRAPENTSLARAKGFNRKSTMQFFDLLKQVYDGHAYPPSRIWNVDETGISTVQTRNSKVVARKGQHQVGKLVSAERGVNITVTFAMSAAGQFLPPFFIFPRQRMNDALKVGAPPESVFTCNVNGWSTIDTFSQWYEHFLRFASPTADNPVLLILDGHSSHTKNLEVLEKAKLNHVRIISIPPHTSHRTQPLDVSFMRPLKSYYWKALNRCMKQNNGNPITVYDVAALVNEAFNEAATLTTAQNGFRKTGIYPFNRQAFPESDFAPADFLERTIDQNTDFESSAATEKSGTCSKAGALDCIANNVSNSIVQEYSYAVTSSNIPTADCSQNLESDPDKFLIDLSTFHFIDENGVVTSLVVQEDEQDVVENIVQTDRMVEIPCLIPQKINQPTDQSLNTVSSPGKNTRSEHPLQCITNPANNGQSEVKRKKRPKTRNTTNQENVLSTSSKRCRWDKGFQKSPNKSATFDIAPQMVDLNPRVQKQNVRKRTSGTKKQHCAELTSSPYRKQLKEANAAKDIKTIKKKPGRKQKFESNFKLQDILCPVCGSIFSNSNNGSGWKKCVSCTDWFHIECQDTDENSATCYICV
ncbi:uncharacterized protein LOC134216251 [Armigeres subalbatus]|uniref:uncharacterized protein LOC134216251 n=1 Tax=Armigeres subalbatus TaxID=124917 RepID=UPI002ED22344